MAAMKRRFVPLIGEGAHRLTAAQKAQRFGEARGEAGEVAVHVETALALKIIGEEAEEILDRASRICAMLTRLIERHQ